jgi:SAM-dependent methyltransferase
MKMIEASDRIENKSEFDLDWDDSHVVPSTVYPDLAFLFRQLEEVTLRKVNAKGGEEILDIGCGRATDAMELAQKSGRCCGLEPSENMILHARDIIHQNGTEVVLLRGIGEHLPLKNNSFDKVVCKGALDHFACPTKAVEEMARILRPQGKAIIAVANLESFSCRLGRSMFIRFRKLLRREESIYEKMWETPFDHTYRFDYASLRCLVEPYLEVEQCYGVSLLFGLPWWGMLLNKMPRRISLAILNILDKVARRLPSLSDAIVIECSPKPRENAPH